MTHCDSVHKFVPMLQAMKNPDAKAAKARDDPSMAIGESQEQKGVHSGSTKRDKKKVHLQH